MSKVCVTKLKDRYPQFTETAIRNLVDYYARQKVKHQGLMSEYLKVAKEKASDTKLARLETILHELHFINSKAEAMKMMTQTNFHGDIVDALLTLTEGTTKNVRGKWFSLDNVFRGGYVERHSWALNFIEEGNLMNFMRDDKTFDAIFREGGYYDNAAEAWSKSSDPMERIAWLFKKVNSDNLRVMQSSGSTIKANENFIFSSTHDLPKITLQSEEWVDSIKKRLNWEETHPPVTKAEDPDAVMTAYLTYIADDMENAGLNGNGIMGGRRTFVWKTRADFLEYNKEWGRTNPLDTLMNSIRASSRKAAVHQKLTHDPKRFIKEIREDYARINPSHPQINSSRWREVDQSIDMAMGMGERPGFGWLNPKVSEFVTFAGKAVPGIETLILLGAAPFSALNDFASSVLLHSMATQNSLPMSFLKVAAITAKSLKPGGGKMYAELYGVGLDGFKNELLDMMGGNVSLRNTLTDKSLRGLNTLNSVQLMITGLSYITNTFRKVAAQVTDHAFTKSIISDAPNAFEKQLIGAIDLSVNDISNLRKVFKEQGQINLRTLRNTAAESLTSEFGLTPQAYKDTLHNKLLSLYAETSSIGSPLPRAKQLRKMGRGLPTDHPLRAVLSSLYLFLGTIQKIGNNVWEYGRWSNPQGQLNNASAVKAVAAAVAVLGTSDYLVGTFKREAKKGLFMGEVDWDKIEENFVGDFTRALLTSGAGGIYTNLLMDIFIPYDGSSRARLPSAVADHISMAIRTGANPTERNFKRLLYRSTPFQNVWWWNNEVRREFIFDMYNIPKR